jgi:hypothetical protein
MKTRYKNQCWVSGSLFKKNGRILKRNYKVYCCGCGRLMSIVRGYMVDHVARSA